MTTEIMTPAGTPTIFAKASGGGRAAVAVIRLSGPASAQALRRLAGRLPEPRVATLVTLRAAPSSEPIDRALVLWFPGPHSFTGEDVAELHLHGGRAVVDAMLRTLAGLPHLCPAEPGEFTRRAFRNGKMDLIEVEALADLIDADTEQQRRQALRGLDGALGRFAATLRDSLIEALALAEAMIDFADEDDLTRDFRAELRARVVSVAARIAEQLVAAERGERVRDGLVVTIAGPPNVGKSTLLNRLAGRDVAIVSAYAGTTRDIIEVDLDLGGHALRLIDTAGLRDTADPVEHEGILRARAKAAVADLVLWLDDGSGGSGQQPPETGEVWRIATKADSRSIKPMAMAVQRAASPRRDFRLSALTGQGVDDLLDALSAFAARKLSGAESALVTRLRHRQALARAQTRLTDIKRLDYGEDPELVAEDLREAIAALAALVGTIETEEVLGQIFARFCIGK